MKRTGWLRRYTRLARRTPLARRNEARRARLFERNYGDWSDAIRAMPCWFCGTTTQPRDAAHMVPRSRGGDKTTLLPACRSCHYEIDAMPVLRRTFVETARRLYWIHNPQPREET